jgi:flagellar hook-associated protein 3 FlgL
MRITQLMMSTVFTSHLRKQTAAMLQRQEQIATQKRINRPSDDPGGMARVLRGRSALATIKQYVANIQQGKSRLEMTEQSLSMADDLVQQARRLAQENSGSEVTLEERQFAASQVKEIFAQLKQIANSKYADRYMFAGHQTDTVPFAVDNLSDPYTLTYQGDDGSFRYAIADGVEVGVDADGRNYFQDQGNGGVNIFDELHDLIEGLDHADLEAGTELIKATIDPLAAAHVQLMHKRSEASPKLNRLQVTEQYWTSMQSTVQAAISRDEDADVTLAIIELKNLEVAYESTIAAASRIIQPSLVNFLK